MFFVFKISVWSRNLSQRHKHIELLGGEVRSQRSEVRGAEVVKGENVFPMIPAGAPISHVIIDPPKKNARFEKPVGST